MNFINLTRLNKPIGIYMLLAPVMWALLLAYGEIPNLKILVIFITGTILMRSAGCVINDIADRDFDKYVARTKTRVLQLKKVVYVKLGVI